MTIRDTGEKDHRSIEWIRILEYCIVFIVIPSALFWYAGWNFYQVLIVAYYTIITTFLIQATMSYVSTTAAIPRLRFRTIGKDKRTTDKPLPKATFIVSAYLPNEIDVIEDTLLNILKNVQRPDDGLEVILAYNTPAVLDIEKRLVKLALEWPELILANAYQSRSKVENLNYALGIASGEIIGLLDADHRVAGDCLPKAWRWLATDTDVVQGRCKIRNGSTNILTALIEVEFEVMYGMQHHAKSILFDTALFGGSDGYWRADVLKKIGFQNVLTEDIDATLRAVQQGYVIQHDRSIISTELAPDNASNFWFQRKRWSEGWFECSLKHQLPVLASPHLSLRAKFMWTWLLMWRVTYDALAIFLFPIVFAYWGNRGSVSLPMNGYILFVLVFTLGTGPYEALACLKNSTEPRLPLKRALLYGLMAFPYTLFKNVIQMVAIRDYIAGKREWVVTSHDSSQTKKEAE